MNLTATQFQNLQQSTLSQSDIETLELRAATAAHAKRCTGYPVEGLLIPYFDPFGVAYPGIGTDRFYRLRPDDPKDGPKYLAPKGAGNRPFFPKTYNWAKLLASGKKTTIILTEGEKTAAALCGAGYAAIGLSGVFGWLDRRDRTDGRDEQPATMVEDEPIEPDQLDDSRVIPELESFVSGLGVNHTFVILFDSDLNHNPMVRGAAKKLANWLVELNLQPKIAYLPAEPSGEKNGADDLIYRHGKEAIDLIIKSAVPAFKKTKKGDWVLNWEVEPDLKTKTTMAHAVFLRRWAYRPGRGWHRWDGRRWVVADDGQGTYLDKALYDLSDAIGWRNQGNGVLNALGRSLKAQLAIPDEIWNRPVLAFQNGVLTADGFVPHDPTFYNTHVLTYDYDPLATAPTWEKFLGETLGHDPAAIALVQALFRWAITPKGHGKLPLEICWDLYGKPGTGKGTVLETLRNLAGRENSGTFKTSQLSNPNHLSHMADKLCSISSDDSGYLDDVGIFAEIVSNEPVACKLLYQNIQFRSLNTFLIRAYNDFPGTTGSNNSALDRRIVALMFRHQPATPNENLQAKLNDELAGIFNWVWSCDNASMMARIKEGANVKAVRDASLERFEANNPVYGFLVEAFPSGGDRVLPRDLYKSYAEWSRESGRQPLNQRQFSKKLEDFGCERSGKIGGYRYWSIPAMDNFNLMGHLRLSPSSPPAETPTPPEPTESNDTPRVEVKRSPKGTYVDVVRVFVPPALVRCWQEFIDKCGFKLLEIATADRLSVLSITRVTDESLPTIIGQNLRFPPVFST